MDLEEVAKQQQIKNQEETEKILAAVRAKNEAAQLAERKTSSTSGRGGETTAVAGPGKYSGEDEDTRDAANVQSLWQTGAEREEQTALGRCCRFKTWTSSHFIWFCMCFKMKYVITPDRRCRRRRTC